MIYIGGYAALNNQGIYQLNDDLSFHHQICNEEGTSYFDIDGHQIYTIIKKENRGGIAIYDLNGKKYAEYLCDYKSACFIKKHDNKLYATYYHDDCVQIFDLNLRLLKEIKFPSGSKCHQVAFLKNKIAIVCLGNDEVVFYDGNYEKLNHLKFPKFSGPRHVVINSDEKRMFVVSELSNELFVVDLTKMDIIQTLSILENGQSTTGAAIRLSKDEKHLYTSTRGQNLIKHFIYEQEWKEQQCFHLNGELPRDFMLTDDSIIVGYQGTNLVEKIQLDNNKNLDKVINQINYDKIVCVKVD